MLHPNSYRGNPIAFYRPFDFAVRSVNIVASSIVGSNLVVTTYLEPFFIFSIAVHLPGVMSIFSVCLTFNKPFDLRQSNFRTWR